MFKQNRFVYQGRYVSLFPTLGIILLRYVLVTARFCAAVKVMRAYFSESCILFLSIYNLIFRILSFKST
jgi:hypothetical protein